MTAQFYERVRCVDHVIYLFIYRPIITKLPQVFKRLPAFVKRFTRLGGAWLLICAASPPLCNGKGTGK